LDELKILGYSKYPLAILNKKLQGAPLEHDWRVKRLFLIKIALISNLHEIPSSKIFA